MEDKEQAIFARLLTLSKIREAEIRANPIPFLDKVAEENSRLRWAMENALIALSGADDWDMATDAAPQLGPSMVVTCTLRNDKARDLLKDALAMK